MKTIRDGINTAREKEASGDIDGARELYEQILAEEPKNAVALHNLGLMMTQRGDLARAVSLLEQAVVARPSNPIFHVDLGETYRLVGDYQNAAGCCRTALMLRPKYPEALNTLGLRLEARTLRCGFGAVPAGDHGRHKLFARFHQCWSLASTPRQAWAGH